MILHDGTDLVNFLYFLGMRTGKIIYIGSGFFVSVTVIKRLPIFVGCGSY